MLKALFLAVLFFFLSQNAFAESNSGVMVSKEKVPAQKLTETPAAKTVTLKDSGTTAKSGDSTMMRVAEQKAEATSPVPSEDPKKLPGVEKKTKGVVRGANNFGVAVEYAVDKKEGGFEIWFNYREETKFIGMEDPSELGEGDVVSVLYNEVPGNLRFVKEVELLQKAPKKVGEPEMPEVEGI